MSETIFTRDGATHSFETVDADGVTVDDDGEATFTWDEVPIVRVDAPSDLEGAFDTERFYKIEGARIARPIKQPYHVGDDVEVYKKPAEELQKAAWSFDNAPFTLGHPDTGMVKDVNDIHGFWKNPRYDADEESLIEDLYIPETDEEALRFIEENQDVSVGFHNRVYREYDGDTGDLTDEEGVDGYQVDIYGNHIAGVERGRCSSEQGCGLDSFHGSMHTLSTDETTSFLTKEDQTEQEDKTVNRQPRESTDQPQGIKSHEGEWYAVGPNEHSKDSTDHPGDHMYPVGGCGNVDDAWKLRTQGEDLEISQETLENRIIRAAEAQDCTNVPDTLQEQMDADSACATCGNNNDTETTTMGDNDDDFDIPDLSIDALAEQNDQVNELKAERDEYRETVTEIEEALDLEEDECPCEAVPELKEDRDEKAELVADIREALGLDEETDLAERVEDIADEWQEFRQDEREARLDRLEELGADREAWEEESLDSMADEIDRREEVLDSVDTTSPTGVEETEDSDSEDTETTMSGKRRFGRGHAASAE